MTLLDFFGTGKSIQDAQAAASRVVEQSAPILNELEERLNGVIFNNLNRLDGATITATFTIKLNPVPKATLNQ